MGIINKVSAALTVFVLVASAQTHCHATEITIPLKEGSLALKPIADNALRVRYSTESLRRMPEWVYTDTTYTVTPVVETGDSDVTVILPKLTAKVNRSTGKVSYFSNDGMPLLAEIGKSLTLSTVQGEPTYTARATFDSPNDEIIIGLGQFQDGHLNVRGLSRRLTQVNTQISIPFTLSSRGYGLLWNNYGMTEYNPGDKSVVMQKSSSVGGAVEVDVTSTTGGKKEIRHDNIFSCTVDIPEAGEYALLLDVGQTMARHHNLSVDDTLLVNIDNLWLPPTTSAKAYLDKGTHTFTARLDKNDSPVLHYRLIDNTTSYLSPVADCVDYTIFAGNADDVVSAYRASTGGTPLMPLWSLGYIHCRERFKSQDELLAAARSFRDKAIPTDVIVQDWQYWGKNGWNAMEFDSDLYPDPRGMVDSLHAIDMKMMLSVWSKVDPESKLGRKMAEKGFFIPGTSWVDFFNPEAASFYWHNFSDNLLSLGIDSWWQDATEPENDDLVGRKVHGDSIPGEVFRNAYPLLVNKAVYEGSRTETPQKRTFILTRSAFPGIQRYGTAMWSGDVGNDWQTLRRQIAAGLSFCASGMPWWTYDAGGFFRPSDQHTNQSYIETMIRWIQASVFLPMMRVHGYMSDTEPWLYGDDAEKIITDCIKLRYRLLPYIYSEAAMVTRQGSTIMRPLLFDFADDSYASRLGTEYMFGHSLLVCPVTEAGVNTWSTYMPETAGGWYDFWTGAHYAGGGTVATEADLSKIPVFVKAGSILPTTTAMQSTADAPRSPIELTIYPGSDGAFDLYEDDGTSYEYEEGQYSIIPLRWDNASRRLFIGASCGLRKPANTKFTIIIGNIKADVDYSGEEVSLQF